jgi:hypothetical protein
MLIAVKFRTFYLHVSYVTLIEIKVHKTLILQVVLYEWETWSVALKKKQKLKVIGNEVLRKISGPQKHTNERHTLYPSSKNPVIRAVKSRWHGGRAVQGLNCLCPLKHWDRDSNSTRGIDICFRLFCVCVVLCVGSGLATVWSPVQEVLLSVYKIHSCQINSDWKQASGPNTKDGRNQDEMAGAYSMHGTDKKK